VNDPLEELLSIVQRDLAAASVRVVDAAAEPANEPSWDELRELRCDLPGGRGLIVTFAEPPADVVARRRRLEMLVSAFADTLAAEGAGPRTKRPEPARSLQEELAALAQRAGAVEAVVIDAHSPVVWGSATATPEHAAHLAGSSPDLRSPGALHQVGPDDIAAAQDYGIASAQGLRVDPAALRLLPRAVCAHRQVMPIARNASTLILAMADPGDVEAIHDVVLITGLDVEPVFAGESMASFMRHLDDQDDDARSYDEVMARLSPEVRAAHAGKADEARDVWGRMVLTRRAIAEVRALPETAEVHRGRHVRHSASEPRFGYLARSFSGIYVVILVFAGPFEELLAKRALTHALPTIERLVAALPPLDPPPRMGGVVAMRPGRRRR
jgi:hypothetical protein